MLTSPTAPTAARRAAASAACLFVTCALLTFPNLGCRTAPVSGRKQLVLIPEAQEINLGVEAYKQTLADEPMSQDEQLLEMVNRVGRRIAAVADKPEYDWEFRVIAKDVMNAFALPGGKVAIYEGILPVCQDEAGVAVVMSHEIAHALARHGGERMSHQSVSSGFGGVIQAVSQRKASEATTEKVMQVYGAASKYGVILPYSRKHESEADAIGLILMAKAGYDPSAAPEFWERFSKQSGEKPPEWLSTHPADARRAADLRALLPEAIKYYQSAPQQLGLGEPLPINRRPARSLAVRQPSLPSTSLDQLSFAPGSPRKATQGPPPPVPERIDPFLDHDTVATSVPRSIDAAAFMPPVTADPDSRQTIDPYQLEGPSFSPLDEGWSPATGRASIQ